MAIRAALWTLFLVIFLDLFQLFFVIPLLPALIGSFGGLEDEVTSKVALLTTLGAAAEAIGCPIVGWLSDRFGRKPMLMLATFGAALSAAVFGFSRNFYEAAGARIIAGLCGGTMGVAQAYVADLTTTEDEQSEAQSKMQASTSLGIMIGPAVGGLLFSWKGIEIACLFAGGLSFLNLVLIMVFLRETAPSRQGTREVVLLQGAEAGRSPAEVQASAAASQGQSSALPCKLWILFFAWTAGSPIGVVFDAFAVLFLSGKYFDGDQKHATQFMSCCASSSGAVTFVVSMWLYGPIKRSLGFTRTLLSGGCLVVAGLLGMGLMPEFLGPVPFLLGVLLMFFGVQLVMPSIPTLIGSLAPPQSLGRAFGLNQSLGNWSRVLAPTVFTPLFIWWPSSVWLVGALLFSILTAVVLLVSRMRGDEQGEEEQSHGANASAFLRHSMQMEDLWQPSSQGLGRSTSDPGPAAPALRQPGRVLTVPSRAQLKEPSEQA
eukprot:TRINITY_DN24302_c0_g1_i1.p1 TRINITY_DN24302_c0_g1~~TRINITY_DN24302_c0_g1_i1.p1  ORF type:complete len:488 (+),score=99.10 TRINITY_DN24302_c0_g1_i1:43-1506(+)